MKAVNTKSGEFLVTDTPQKINVGEKCYSQYTNNVCLADAVLSKATNNLPLHKVVKQLK